MSELTKLLFAGASLFIAFGSVLGATYYFMFVKEGFSMDKDKKDNIL